MATSLFLETLCQHYNSINEHKDELPCDLQNFIENTSEYYSDINAQNNLSKDETLNELFYNCLKNNQNCYIEYFMKHWKPIIPNYNILTDQPEIIRSPIDIVVQNEDYFLLKQFSDFYKRYNMMSIFGAYLLRVIVAVDNVKLFDYFLTKYDELTSEFKEYHILDLIMLYTAPDIFEYFQINEIGADYLLSDDDICCNIIFFDNVTIMKKYIEIQGGLDIGTVKSIQLRASQCGATMIFTYLFENYEFAGFLYIPTSAKDCLLVNAIKNNNYEIYDYLMSKQEYTKSFLKYYARTYF